MNHNIREDLTMNVQQKSSGASNARKRNLPEATATTIPEPAQQWWALEQSIAGRTAGVGERRFERIMNEISKRQRGIESRLCRIQPNSEDDVHGLALVFVGRHSDQDETDPFDKHCRSGIVNFLQKEDDPDLEATAAIEFDPLAVECWPDEEWKANSKRLVTALWVARCFVSGSKERAIDAMKSVYSTGGIEDWKEMSDALLYAKEFFAASQEIVEVGLARMIVAGANVTEATTTAPADEVAA